MNCPLCHSSKIKETLFVARNAFISSSKLDNLVQRKNPKKERGGGYYKGNNTITFTQYQDYGYIYNSAFNLNKISKEYQSEGYFSRKIVSKAMGNNIKTIKDKISKIYQQNSTYLEVAPGSADMVNALIHDVKIYIILSFFSFFRNETYKQSETYTRFF